MRILVLLLEDQRKKEEGPEKEGNRMPVVERIIDRIEEEGDRTEEAAVVQTVAVPVVVGAVAGWVLVFDDCCVYAQRGMVSPQSMRMSFWSWACMMVET